MKQWWGDMFGDPACVRHQLSIGEHLYLMTKANADFPDRTLQPTITFQIFPVCFPLLLFNHIEDCQAVSYVKFFGTSSSVALPPPCPLHRSVGA